MNVEVRPRKWSQQVLDVVVYALAVTAVVFLASFAVSLVFGSGWLGVELLMFVVGWLLFGYGTFQLRPRPPWKTEKTADGKIKVTDTREKAPTVGSRQETRFQATVQRIPPLRWYRLPPEERLSIATKLFVSGVAVLVASFLVERLLVV